MAFGGERLGLAVSGLGFRELSVGRTFQGVFHAPDVANLR